MRCLDENTVAELFQGALAPRARMEVEAHVDRCRQCRAVVSALGAELGGSTQETSDPGPPDGFRLRRGDAVGRYIVVELLGVGSMGIVYGAYDPDLDRKLALKLLRPDLGGSEEPREQRLREAQSMARLSHPNIVTVHDVGLRGDRVFIAMEYVEGKTLRAWLHERPRSTAAILDVFVAAGRGLAAAHEASVVHRDFKPDNVLVATDGRVCVTDFGLAAVQTDLQATACETPRAVDPGGSATGVVGTPRYMAPEQHRGQRASPQTDQFGFCVALFEALYGQPPFAGGSAGALALAVEAGRVMEPPDDAKAPAAVRRVVLRGLAPVPEDRYADMAALLDALRHVRRPRIREWTVAGLGAAGAVVFALWSTAEPRTCEGVELSDVWNVAQRHRIESAVRASGASYGPDLIRRIGPRLDAHARAWMAMTRDACEANRMRHTQSDDVFGLRMACLEDRRRELVAVVEVLGELSPSTVEHALDTIGGLGSIEACADVPMLVRRDRDEHRQPMPDDLAQALARVETLVDAGDFDRAFAQVEPLLATAHGSFEHEGEILLAQAWVQVHTEPAQAQQVLHEALLAAEVSGADDLRLRAMILMVFVVGYAQGHHTDGLRWGELADALAQKLQASPLLTARLARYRGRIQQEQGNYDGALMSYEGARTVLENAGLSDHLEAVKATAALADVLRARQRYGEGEAYLREAVQQYREMAGPEHPRVANALHALGDVVAAQDRPDEATQLYRETLRMLQDSSGREHVDVGGVRLALGRVALGRGDLAGARAELETAHTIFERNLPPEHPRQAQVLASLAELRVHEHRDHDALPLLLQAVDVRRRATPRHPDFAVVLLNLGTLHLRMGDPVAATVALREAVAVAEAALGAEHAFVTEIRAKLSEATGER